MTSEEMDSKGEWVWLPDPTECFVAARIVSHTATSVTGVDAHGHARTADVKRSTLESMKRSSLQRVVADLVLMDVMSAPLILHNLKQRFLKHEIYTNVGTILIAINPYKVLPLYTDEVTRTYARRKLGQEMPPHVFNIAHDAFVGLRDFEQNQSIIISGESGAGKTEATKHCLHYLAFMAGSGSGVAHSILKTNPILEAFGNAKTLRNDNSSRFGKFMQIFFQGRHCAMSGCWVRNYLLEKIRVVRQSANERNFHVFYQLSKGASAEQKKKYKLSAPEQYRYLKTCVNVSSIDDQKDFAEVLNAFTELGFKQDEQDRIFSVVSAVASLGNVEFKDHGESSSVRDTSATSPVAAVAELLDVPLTVLSRALVIRELRIKNQQTTEILLKGPQAEAQRDAFAKFIYGNLFNWLVERLNQAIGQPSDTSKYIGCLDIFGFEIFENNSFEQLCINFTNEMLQQHFNYQTFKLEEMVYKAENIKFKHIEFIDNQPMLDLIAKRPHGLLPILDEELVVPRGSDMGFLTKLQEYQAGNQVFRRNMKQPTVFMIKHYAGLVGYEVEGFLEKNRDSLTDDQLDVLRASTNPLINVLFPPDREVSGREKKQSLGFQFRSQLDALMTTLRQTEPHYIRCIKPNPHKAATAFVPVMCMEQLTYSGVFEAVAIRKAGFPFRLKHDVFAERYGVLFEDGQQPSRGTPIRDQCDAVIKLMKLDRENVQMGTSMVLYRADEHKKLELHRNIKVRLTETQQDLDRLIKVDPSGFSEGDKESFFIELAGAVRSADEFRIQTPAAQTARKLLDRYVEERMDPATKRKLEEALAAKDMHKLVAVLKICEANGYQTTIVRKCQELLERIQDAEAALKVARSELSEDYLQRAIGMCEEFGYEAVSVQEARALLANINKAKEMIRRSMESLNHEHLKKTLEFCASFGYNTALVQECSAKYKQIMHVRELLNVGRHSVEIVALAAALKAADDIGYDAALVHECRLLHGRLERIDAEAERALITLNEKHVKAVLTAASEVKFKSKSVKKLRSLAEGKPADYIQAQFNAAVKCGDHERAIAINCSLKAQRCVDKGAALQLKNYHLLKDPMYWGKEKWWGSAQHRADTFLSFTDASLHAPLTRAFDNIDKQRLKMLLPKMVNNFESIQKYMGQRNSVRIPQRVEEILMDCMECPEIRDEFYIAMIKQLTLNPLSTAVAKGWDLLALALLAFPPSMDFEEYLFAFLLANQSAWGGRDFAYWLSRITYLNAVPRPFWGCRMALDDVPGVTARNAPVRRSEAKDGAVPWEDILIKFEDDDYEDLVKDAYKKAKAAAKALDAHLASERKVWDVDMNDRKRAANLRDQGISASIPPPVNTPIEHCIPGSHAAPAPASSSSSTTTSASMYATSTSNAGGSASQFSSLAPPPSLTIPNGATRGGSAHPGRSALASPTSVDTPGPNTDPEKKKKKKKKAAAAGDADDAAESKYSVVEYKNPEEAVVKKKKKKDLSGPPVIAAPASPAGGGTLVEKKKKKKKAAAAAADE